MIDPFLAYARLMERADFATRLKLLEAAAVDDRIAILENERLCETHEALRRREDAREAV